MTLGKIIPLKKASPFPSVLTVTKWQRSVFMFPLCSWWCPFPPQGILSTWLYFWVCVWIMRKKRDFPWLSPVCLPQRSFACPAHTQATPTPSEIWSFPRINCLPSNSDALVTSIWCCKIPETASTETGGQNSHVEFLFIWLFKHNRHYRQVAGVRTWPKKNTVSYWNRSTLTTMIVGLGTT